MLTNPSGAPSSYEELHEHYRQFVENVVRKNGIIEIDVEDVASEIITVFFKRGALAWYDPDKIHDTESGPKTAKFASFLGGFASLYLRHHRDKQRRRLYRETLCPPATSTEVNPTSFSNAVWLRSNAITALDSQPEADEWVTKASQYLATQTPQLKLDYLLTRCVEMMELDGKVSRNALSEELGISTNMVRRRIIEMRRLLTENGWYDELCSSL